MKLAGTLSETGKYYYVNPYGGKHACGVIKKNGNIFITFSRNEKIDIKYLKGRFYFRK